MAVAAFATDSENTLDNKVDQDAPNATQVAPNQVPVAANGDPSSSNPAAAQPATAATPTKATGEASTTSADAKNSPTGAGPAASGGSTPAPAQSNIPGPGSQPATTVGQAGPGSQPATTAPAGTGPAASGQPPAPKVTEGANGASYVEQQAGTSASASAPDNSRFTSTTVGGQDRDKTRDKETGGKVYNPWAAESTYHRDEAGNIATGENLAGPEKYVAHTSVRSSGEGKGDFIVDYTKFGPDGTPMSPAEDVEGWNKLTPDQQEAAMRDYVSNLEEWEKKQPGAKPQLGGGLDPEFFDPEKWKDMPPEARKEAVKAWLEGKTSERAEAAAKEADTPKITVNPDGSVSYKTTDSKGQPIAPWADAEVWKTLTPEQQQDLYKQWTDNKKIIDSGGVLGEDENFLGTGMRQSEFLGLSQDDQGFVMQNPGWEAPQHNSLDNSTTYREKPVEGQDGVHEYTLDKNGRKTSETWPAGVFGDKPVTYTYGADNSQTMTTEGLTVTTDSQGNTVETTDDGWVTTTQKDGKPVLSVKEDSPAADQLATGYGPQGQKLTLGEQAAARLGIRVEDMTADQWQTVYGPVQEGVDSQEGYAKGRVVGTLALQLGLISQAEFDTINNSRESGSSWGAWLISNKDVLLALGNAGLDGDTLSAMAADSYFQKPNGMRSTAINESFLNELQQLNGYGYTPRGQTAADALKGVNVNAATDPSKMYEQAFGSVGPGIVNSQLYNYAEQVALDDTLSDDAKRGLLQRLMSQAGKADHRSIVTSLLYGSPKGSSGASLNTIYDLLGV